MLDRLVCYLIVDAEEAILDMASTLLTSPGYDVSLADGGEEALEIYKREEEEIAPVILDPVMPKTNGIKTFQRIREIDPDAKILFSSGFTRGRSAQELLKPGAAGFMSKPYRPAGGSTLQPSHCRRPGPSSGPVDRLREATRAR